MRQPSGWRLATRAPMHTILWRGCLEKPGPIWDLETVPDLAAAARMLDLTNASDADVREAWLADDHSTATR
jgi:hypothetical protein